jgi:hypothetical protein
MVSGTETIVASLERGAMFQSTIIDGTLVEEYILTEPGGDDKLEGKIFNFK